MNVEINIIKEIKTDVLVIGGGTAGVFAAISVSKTGAKTILIEKNSSLGGTVTVANVNFPGLFYAWGRQIISGPGFQAIERTVKLGGAKLPSISYKPQGHWQEQILLNRFVYTAVLFEMCRESEVEVFLNAMVTKAEETTEGVIAYITEKSGVIKIYAKKAIDATGDANLIQLMGFPVEKSKVQQPGTMQNEISGYNMKYVDIDDIKTKFEGENFPDYITYEKLISYLNINKIDVHVSCKDADTSEGKTKLEFDTMALMMKIFKFYKKIKGLENLTVNFIAEETGVRESNRIIGEGIVTAEDYINGYHYLDSICYAFYPIDLHVMDGVEQKFHTDGVVSKIPYSALIPKNSNHTLCAGRCISSDCYANSAIRVQAVCMATGQAAGCAAAISSKNNASVKSVSYGELCDSLRGIGAIVPK